jgi:hypothetical protein
VRQKRPRRPFAATVRAHFEHDPEKCEAVFRKDHAQNNNLKRDDDSSSSHRALAAFFHALLMERDRRDEVWSGTLGSKG